MTGARDECDLRQPKESTLSWESQRPAVKVSIFKGRQRQWESCGTARPLTEREAKFFQSVCSAPLTGKRRNPRPRHVNSAKPCKSEWFSHPVIGLQSSQMTHTPTHTLPCDFISNSVGVYFGSHHFPAAETALKSRTI